VTAEEVEAGEQGEFLAGAGCNALQRILFSSVIPEEEVASLLTNPLYARRMAWLR
jgi:hypothetical protein